MLHTALETGAKKRRRKMMKMLDKMFIALVFSMATCVVFTGCSKKEDKPSAEKPGNVVSQADKKANTVMSEAVGVAKEQVGKPQTKCPVMGGPVDKTQYVDVKGYRIYVCCPGCIEKIKADPDKYIAIIIKNGETPEKLPTKK